MNYVPLKLRCSLDPYIPTASKINKDSQGKDQEALMR